MRWLRRLLGGQAAPAPVTEPPDPEEWLRAGYDCESRGDVAGAERHYRRILEHDPAHTDAHYYLSRIAASGGRDEEAIALLHKAVDLRPEEAVYLEALGDALLGAKRYDEAAEVFHSGVALLPDSTAMRNQYAVALIEGNRRDAARVELESLLEILPDAPEVHFNLGGIYREYGQADEAIGRYRRTLQLKPGHAPTYSNLLVQLNYSAGLDAAAVFADHQRFGEQFARRYEPPVPDSGWPRRLRIGYLSPDFRNHVVMRFMEPILGCHDRELFEICCYYNHSEIDAVTERLRKHADLWIQCEELSDAQLAERIRADRIDILVDLAGHTVGNRLLVLAMKPAPIQATYLGYPNTTGLGAVDYRISDAYADPPGESDGLSVERLLRLPGSYFCYRPGPHVPPVGPLPVQKSGIVTFGCFNNFAKLSGPFLDTAARVLGAVPNSRLLLKGRPLSIVNVAQSVHARFERAGIDPDRVELRGWEGGGSDHLSTYDLVDIALDSFPYNGATTTCEAMWMGVPVVTLAGDRHVGRVGSSLLNAVGLSEYVARDAGEYVAICARLAGDVARLATLRDGLRERMRRSPLMDETAFTRALERCYLGMWENRLGSGVDAGAPRVASAAELLGEARQSRAEGRLAEAEAACKDILRHQPDHLDAITLLWDLAFESGAPGAIIDRLVKTIEVNGAVAGFHHMLGCALQAQGKIVDAAASFSRALELDPTHAKARNNLGCLLEAAGNLREAAQCYREATRFDPNLAHAFYNLGNVCKQLGDPAQAIGHIAQALAIESGHADWHCNRGNLQYGQLRLDEAIVSFKAAIKLDPAYDRAYASLGAALVMTGSVEDAGAAFRKALELKPEPGTEAWLLLLRHYRQGEDAKMLFDEHRSWANRHARRQVRFTDHRGRAPALGRRINVGYVSPDFRRHPVAYFIEPVLAAHDRDAFNVFCYASAGGEDEVTLRLRSISAHWRDISMLSDTSAADRIRTDGIDVLVDLAGHTGGGRLLLFACKPAPVQIAWLGYPNTTGLDTMDYRLSDAVADPPGRTERFHSERLVRLARGFLCYAPPKESPEVAAPPNSGEGSVTFGCFNNLAKVTPEMVALWVELLRRLPDARLILKSYGLAAECARRDFRERFLVHGIGGERVHLRQAGSSVVEHLSRYSEIDIALDVFPYNGTTTTCEALWMGVPVVTLAGATHLSRVGASILNSVGLSEFVADTPGQYLDIAHRLAVDINKRRELRAGMRARMRSSPLLDATGFARELEAAYREMLAAA